MYTTILLTVRIYCKEYTLICFTLFLITMCYMYLQGYQALFTNTLIYIISRNLQMAIGHQNLMFVDYVGSASGLDLQIYRPFHKTLPKSSAFINKISVRFYETDCILYLKHDHQRGQYHYFDQGIQRPLRTS